MNKATLSPTTLSSQLLCWYQQHGRSLPWRNGPCNPYKIWVSEIMLQQTTVAAVIPFYNKFLDHFPTLDVLAEASITGTCCPDGKGLAITGAPIICTSAHNIL